MSCLLRTLVLFICITLTVALSMKTTGSRSLRMSTEEPASPVEIPKTTISQAMARSNPGRSWFKCKTIGIGSMAGQESLPNSIFESLVDTNDKWISKRTGIRNRHVIKEGSSLKDLAIESAKQALESSGVAGEDIDLVIYASSTPDDLFGDAPGIAMAIGASKAAAFDLTAACSGFVYGMVTASQFLHSGTYKKVLVVGGDALTRYLDWTDRGTCILFGDGSGAVVMEATDSAEESGMLGFALHSDGTRGCNLRLPYNNKFEALSNEAGSVVDQGSYGKMYMNGAEVYKFAVSEVPVVIAEALKNSGYTADDVDWLLLHQANIRIMEGAAEALGIPMSKVLKNIEEYGNTSAGSIPLALDEAVKSGKVKKGDIIAVAGFGAGLSWASAIIRWGG